MKMKHAKGPRIADVQIPTQMKKWALSLGLFAGILSPGQDMVNHFALELTRGGLEISPHTPFATGDLSSTPWVPSGPNRCLGGRAKNGRNSNLPIKGRLPSRSLRKPSFSITCGPYLPEASLVHGPNLGGLAAHISHLGTRPAIANNENATAAMTYDKAIRAVIETNSRKRISAEQRVKLVEMLKQEHGTAKKSTIRDMAASNGPRPVKKTVIKTYKKGDPRRPKGQGGRQKGEKGKNGGQQGRRGSFWQSDGYRL